MEKLISAKWLANQITADDQGAKAPSNLIILDASAHLPSTGRDPADEFAAGHIPSARFLDLASLFDPEGSVPLALPTADQFAIRMADLGISFSSHIVLYDDSDVNTSARAWFILRLHGIQNLAILDGGLAKWRAENGPMESGQSTASKTSFSPSAGIGTIRLKSDITANLKSETEQVLDARWSDHFTGEAEDVMPGSARGHIPNSRNLPFPDLLKTDGTFKPSTEIHACFANAGIDLDKPIVTTCGGGVAACVLLFALDLIGKKDIALYDGSWGEWGSDPDTPKETGPALRGELSA